MSETGSNGVIRIGNRDLTLALVWLNANLNTPKVFARNDYSMVHKTKTNIVAMIVRVLFSYHSKQNMLWNICQ